MILSLLLFLSSQCFASSVKDISKVIVDTTKESKHTDEYKLLQAEIDTLTNHVKTLEKEQASKTKRNVAKTIGYTSSSLGLVSSVWALWEKSLSIENTMRDLTIRLGTREQLKTQIADLEANGITEPFQITALNHKISSLADVEEKIGNLNMRLRISRLGYNRALFKGATSVGVFILTLFVDDIDRWWNETFKTPHQVAMEYLRSTKYDVVTMSLYDNNTDIPFMDKPFYYVISAPEELGISDSVKYAALDTFKKQDLNAYNQFISLFKTKLDEVLREYYTNSYFQLRESLLKDQRRQFAPIDGTYYKIRY